jgi:hypothetical protein
MATKKKVGTTKKKVGLPSNRVVFGGMVPQDVLVKTHLASVSPKRIMNGENFDQELQGGSLALYRSLAPRNADAEDSVLATLAVSVTNVSLDCLARAVSSDQLPTRDLNLRHGLKGVRVAAELIRALDSRRGRNQKAVTVGNVNVGSGGQAIVGNVQSGRARDEAESDSEPDTHQPKDSRRGQS